MAKQRLPHNLTACLIYRRYNAICEWIVVIITGCESNDIESGLRGHASHLNIVWMLYGGRDIGASNTNYRKVKARQPRTNKDIFTWKNEPVDDLVDDSVGDSHEKECE